MNLHACPFCGAAGRMVHDTRAEHRAYHHWHVVCSDDECGAVGPVSDTEPLAAVSWNRREP